MDAIDPVSQCCERSKKRRVSPSCSGDSEAMPQAALSRNVLEVPRVQEDHVEISLTGNTTMVIY